MTRLGGVRLRRYRLGGSVDTWYLDLRSWGNEARFWWSTTEKFMRTYTAVIERDQTTGLYVGYVPGWAGAHSQGESLDELRANLHEVMQMLLEDGDPALSAEFIGTQTLEVA